MVGRVFSHPENIVEYARVVNVYVERNLNMAYNQGPSSGLQRPITDRPPMNGQAPVTSQVLGAGQVQYLPKKWSTALLLCSFLGPFGAHRFYVGKTGTAILQILTTFLGFGAIWSLIDLIMIATGSFKDKNGQSLVSPYPRNTTANLGQSKSASATLLFCLFLGVFGAHRFYVGKIGTAILLIITTLFGVGAIWMLIDFITIAIGSFKDKNEQPLVSTW